MVSSEVGEGGVTLQVEDAKSGEAKDPFTADCVLVSTGRKPNTDNMGLDEIGVKRNPVGMIEVNDHFQTGVDGLFAIGDCIQGSFLFT